jgi:hypothetical protein
MGVCLEVVDDLAISIGDLVKAFRCDPVAEPCACDGDNALSIKLI